MRTLVSSSHGFQDEDGKTHDPSAAKKACQQLFHKTIDPY